MYLISDKVRNSIIKYLDWSQSKSGYLGAEKKRQLSLLSRYLKKLKRHSNGQGPRMD